MRNRVPIGILGVGCLGLLCLVALAPLGLRALGADSLLPEAVGADVAPLEAVRAEAEPNLPLAEPVLPQGDSILEEGMESLTDLYRELTPGVVSIQVAADSIAGEGQGAGSGFILDEQGHIITNNHVVAGSTAVTVVFHNDLELRAEVIGTDEDSDLAVIQVEELPEGTRPLVIGDSDLVQPGEWVVAIGNPFRLGGSMSLGIVSAVGRTIPAGGTTPFSIPQVIQTDAAINPGNSGGPLLNLRGEVIGVNAQIATGGNSRANAGVGFSIPSNIVSRVVPSLIRDGSYNWPWLGVSGTDVNLRIAEANNLEGQQGAYISAVVGGGPAAEAGLRGSDGSVEVEGLSTPVGGDIILRVEGRAVMDFDDLLAEVVAREPGESLILLVLRDGETIELEVLLEGRPSTIVP